MRIGSLLALIVAAVAIAVAASAAVAGPGPPNLRSPVRQATTTTTPVKPHPLRLSQLGISSSYAWAQPGGAAVSTPHAQPWL